jgi:hypothetical protein
MKKVFFCAVLLALVFTAASLANAYLYVDNFSTPWSGNYAPGWANESVTTGASPTVAMSPITVAGVSGVALSVTSADPSQFWGLVYNTNIDASAMATQYNPYIKVMFYDSGASNLGGQLYAVPTTSYTPQSSDWTDVQLGVRLDQAGNYWYIAQQPGGTTWMQTSVARAVGWHELEVQLSAVDGMLHFYIDGTQVGTSVRSDYTNLGPIMLGTMFDNPLSNWTNAPSVAFANVEVGSDATVPIPPAILLLGPAFVGLLAVRRRFKG